MGFLICLVPTGNIQGTYNFLNLLSGLVIKRREFDELPAPDSIIQRVNTLAGKKSISSHLFFADRNQVPFDWLDNTAAASDGLDPTPFAQFPDIPAEMPGVELDRHKPSIESLTTTNDSRPAERDWSHLANKALANADLDISDGLPPPPEVIALDDDEDDHFIPPTNTLPPTKVELAPPPKVEQYPTLPSIPTRRSTLSDHWNDLRTFFLQQWLRNNTNPPSHPIARQEVPT